MKKRTFGLLMYFLLFSIVIGAQTPNAILEIETKDSNGEIQSLKDRLLPDLNYLILVFNIEGNYDINHINEIKHQKNYWKEKYNIEVILLEDKKLYSFDTFGDIINSLEIPYSIYATDSIFNYGTNNYRYIIPANTNHVIRRSCNYCNSYDSLFDEYFKTTKYRSVFNQSFTQAVISTCDEEKINYYDNTKDTIIENVKYYKFDSIFLREDPVTKSILKYRVCTNSCFKNYVTYIRYPIRMCKSSYLKDFEGDKLKIKIIDIIETEHSTRYITNRFIVNPCSQDSIPFELVQGIGTNAGILFDIEDDKIVSFLVCHKEGETTTYQYQDLSQFCGANSTTTTIDNTFKLYPNPARDIASIDFKNIENRTVQLYNMKGQLLFTSKYNQQKIDLSLKGYQGGIYYIEIVDKKGNYQFEKLVILD